MTIHAIGAGLGRTGTLSLNVALEQLLGGPCYRMIELFKHPEHVQVWERALAGHTPDWDTLFAGFRATGDWTSAAFFAELANAYPDAIVLLSVRDADDWWRSFRDTMLESLQSEVDHADPWERALAPARQFTLRLLADRFTPDWTDEVAAKAAFERHNAAVRAAIPRGRLVEWRPGDGWGPICAALGLPVPADSFPHVNTTAVFRAGRFDVEHLAREGQAQAAPIPPRELIERTGGRRPVQSDEWFIRESYERAGRERKAGIIEALPDDWSFEGRRVLDFGCGSGRVLRQFLPEAVSGEFWGCDLHRPTIAWLDEHLSPPLRFFVNDQIPTPHPDSYFDLVYAISVFTHITHEWSAWLLELHRILKPEGLLLATIIGPEAWGRSLSRPPDENGLGMCVQRLGRRPGDQSSGARVLHSPWWLRAHWGRAFEILSLASSGFAGGWHGFVLGRKKGVSLTRDDLEWPDPEDPRELEAQRQQLLVLEQEGVQMGERREQQKLLRAMLGSRAFAVAEQLSRLHQRGRPVFSRQQIRRALGDEDGPT